MTATQDDATQDQPADAYAGYDEWLASLPESPPTPEDDANEAALPAWLAAWRNGFAKVLTPAQLDVLRLALLRDDPALTQGATTTPPPLHCVLNWPCEAACAIGYAGWHDGADRGTVGEVEEFFAAACYAADRQLGEPAGCRHFLTWFDDTPRDEMRRLLLAEIDRTLADHDEAARVAAWLERHQLAEVPF